MIKNVDKKIENIIFIVLIAVIAIFFLFLLVVSISSTEYCQFETFSESLLDDNKTNIEITPKEISLIPEIKNINCIGKIASYSLDDSSPKQIGVYGSTNFLYLLNLMTLSINLFFIIFKKNNTYLYLFLITSMHLITEYLFKAPFSKWLISYENIVLLPILISLYFSTLNFDKKTFEKCIFSIWIFCLFLNYDYFFWISIVIFVFKMLQKNYNFQIKKAYFLSYFVIFYSIRAISALLKNSETWRRLSSNIYESPYFFNDLKILFEYFNCNYYFDATYCAEKFNLGYGPLTLLISFKNNEEFLSLFFAIIFIIIFLLFGIRLIKSSIYPGIMLMILLSPPINFVIERLNMDFIILLVCLVLFKNYENKYIFKSLILLIFVLLKLYMVAVIFTLIFVSLKKKQIMISFFNSLLTLISVIYLFNVLISSETMLSKIPNPFGYSWSFGLVSLAKNLSMIFTQTTQINFYITLVLIITFIIFLLYKRNFNLDIADKDAYLTYSIISIFVITGMFSNFDYRLALLLPLFTLRKDIFVNDLFDNLIVLFMLSSSSPYVRNFSLNPIYGFSDFFASLIILINSLLFILILSICIFALINLFLSTVVKKNFRKDQLILSE